MEDIHANLYAKAEFRLNVKQVSEPMFPFFQVPYLGNGMVIGTNAVIHVLISHGFAIGAFSLLIIGERHFGILGQRNIAFDGWNAFSRSFLGFLVFVITLIGAVTGAGIWFTTMALAPRAISHMLRIFFWAWFFEYFTFFGEIVILLVIYFQWDNYLKHKPGLLKKLGTVYITFACVSAVTICAILGFMLTPGAWISYHGFWQAVLNPSFLPQLAARLSFAFILGSLIIIGFALLSAAESFRRKALRFYGRILLVSIVTFSIALLLYYTVLPMAFASHIRFSVLTSHFSRYPVIFSAGNVVLFLMLIACAVFALRKWERAVRMAIIPSLIAIILLVVQFERIREFVRGPYLMPGYMYANDILLEEEPVMQTNGILGSSPWYHSVYPQSAYGKGAYLFARSCMACHTVGGINDIRKRLADRTPDGIYVIIGHTHEMIPFMPPFSGNEQERKLMADYLYQVLNNKVRVKSLSRSIVGDAHE